VVAGHPVATVVRKGVATLTAAVVSAVTGMVVLLVAVFLSNTVLAAIAIGIAVVGLILLSRDWRKERGNAEADGKAGQEADRRPTPGDTSLSANGLTPELFTPDVSYEEAVQEVDDDDELDLGSDG
jgi:hypothetical protein